MLGLIRAGAAVFQQRHVIAAAPGAHRCVLDAGIGPGAGHGAVFDVELAQDGVEARIVEAVIELLLDDEVLAIVVFELLHHQRFFRTDDRVRNGKLEMPVDWDFGLLEGVVDEDDGNAFLPRDAADLLVVLDQGCDAFRCLEFRLRRQEVGEHIHHK